jgi:hemerythrin-like metal-binding protein
LNSKIKRFLGGFFMAKAPFVEWKQETFGCGIRRIDFQHRRLVELINELYEAMVEGRAEKIISHIINELAKYTKYHFSTEEEYMKKYGYPTGDAEFHIKEHRNFVVKVLDFHKKYQKGEQRLTREVMTFLRTWLVHHILNVDKKLGNFLRQKGAI